MKVQEREMWGDGSLESLVGSQESEQFDILNSYFDITTALVREDTHQGIRGHAPGH
jgi:hypothetical protein